MRRHPNRRASRDHAPGPIMASATHIAAKRILLQGSPDLVIRARNANVATRHPETGVHSPTHRSAPAIIAVSSRIVGWTGCTAVNSLRPWVTTAVQATSRRTRRPAPGQPCANVEKRRRKKVSQSQRARLQTLRPRPNRVCPTLFWAVFRRWRNTSGLDDPAPDADHRGVRPIVRTQFREDILDATLDCVFCN